jgi:hypothetical protein
LEYILPYRFTQERLDYWRDSLQMDKSLLNKIEYYDDIKYLPSKIGYFTLPDIRSHNTNFLSSVFGTSIIGNCYYTSVKDLIKCRAMGIPAAIDFIPFYGNRNGYHGSETYITPEVHMPEKKYLTERKAPKIYRVTYSSNNMYEGKKDEYVPELFRDPFIRDVTDLYASTKDVSIPNLRRLDSRPDYAYLCVFNNLDWQPVAIGEYGRLVDFDKMGDDIIYLPVAYDKDERKTPLNYPFILYRNGKTEYLTPDTTTKQTIVLTRKYPGNMNINTMLRQLDASFWTASHSSDFADADTVFTYLASGYILDVEAKHGGDMPARRYWKFTQGNPSAMPAEFIFFGSDGEILKINADKPFDALFDGDPLTNTVIQNDLIIDLGKDTAVSKIVCIPRTDGNGIVPGNLYELLYHDLDGWKSLGKKIADDCIIKYDNVPAGALLWLHNHTTGIEERIFTAKNGEIRFW